ncbi:MAG: hypothetical protein GF383_01350 [Candidatus Lokiarchaeota archaeon]|nr:hypothetical protein [Candidatus Lokiarchaeota archaeon]MBD3337912.1 hypothetical protein [Candidatus Lokiarchaeota archaeon]
MGKDYWKRMLLRGGENYSQNLELIKSILKENRGYVIEAPIDEYIILLFSGGMDSTILIDIIIRTWNCKVILLYFKRNSRNQKWEEKAVDFFFNFYKERYPLNLIELIKLDIEVPLRINKEFLDRSRQKIMGLPLRNSVMWNNTFAQTVYLSGKYDCTIRTVIVGSVKEDGTSPESGILAIMSQTLHTCIALGLWFYQLLAPFIDNSLKKVWSKKDLFAYARNNRIPVEKTRSCFCGDKDPCSECLACQNREKALSEFNKTFKSR